MSQQHVEAVRRSMDAYNRGDLDGFFAGMSADIEFEEDSGLPEAGTYRGREQIRAYGERFQEGMADHRFDIERVHDLGDRVLALVHESGRGRTSGIEVHQHPAFLYEFRDGLIVRVRAFLNRSEALEAAGLSE